MTRLRLGLLATALVVLLGPTPSAHAAREFARGNITAVDWRVMQIEIKNPKGGRETYKVAPNCSVKFTDGAADFPNPRLEDLTPPMYIHFAFENQTMLDCPRGTTTKAASSGRPAGIAWADSETAP